MSSTRVMPGVIDMQGRKVGTLVVGEMVSRHPKPRYRTTCECGAQSTEGHDRLANGAARCMSSSHGKSITPRNDRLEDERREAAKREDDRFREEREASRRRMEADAEGYERPTKYAPTPGPREMTQRERDSLREFRKAEEAVEYERQRPIREAEEQAAQRTLELVDEQQTTLRQLRAVERERVLNLPDEEFQIDPATIGIVGVTADNVDSWHAAQSTQFLADNPQYFRCPENQAAIMGYIERNVPGGLKLLSAAQLTAAYKRLRDLGLLKERPAPTTPAPPTVEHRTERKPAPKPTNPLDEVVDGWDSESGEPRKYTQRQLNRMGSEQYRRALRLYGPDLNDLPNTGPSLRPR